MIIGWKIEVKIFKVFFYKSESSAIIPISLRREKVNLSLRKEKLFNFIMDKRIGQVHNDNENEKKQNQNLFIGITNECANISDEDRINFEKKV